MTDKEPTREQIREFWEWCGLPYDGYGHADRQKAKSLPPIDLNNLFKYAVPKLTDVEITKSRHSSSWVIQVSTGKPIVGEFAEAEHKDPVLALFWAIWEVIKK